MPTRSLFRGLLILWAGLLAATAQAATAYAAPTPFERPGAAFTQPWGINDSGVIVGWSDIGAFVYGNGSFTDFVYPGAVLNTTLTGVANDGTLVGFYGIGDPDVEVFNHGFIVANGVITPFEIAGALSTTVRHISGNGRYLTGDWTSSDGLLNGFAYDRVTAQVTLFPSFGVGVTFAQGANDLGVVTGSFSRPVAGAASVSGALTYDLTSGVRTEFLQVNGQQRPRFRDINNQGVIVGFVGSSAFVGTPGDWTMIDPFDGMNIVAYGINGSGDIVGYTADLVTGDVHGWRSSPVPEPAAWALLACGLAGLGLQARRR